MRGTEKKQRHACHFDPEIGSKNSPVEESVREAS